MSRSNFLSFTMIILLILLSGAVFVRTSGMTPGAELFPRIMAGGLAFFGIIELAKLYGEIRRENNNRDNLQTDDLNLIRKSILYMGAFFVLVILFFVSLPYVGFAIVSILFMLISMVLIGGKKALRKWPVALIVPILLILVFQYGLEVRLPSFDIF